RREPAARRQNRRRGSRVTDRDRDPGASGRPRSPPLAPMTTLAPKDVLLAGLDKVVRETLAYFEGPGRETKARVDRWQARDVLMHFIYFHDATAWGIQSAALGGPPWPVPADSDTVNEVCRRLPEHESLDELPPPVRPAHAPRGNAARN